MYYNTPVVGRAFKPFSTNMVDVSADTVKQWHYKKLVMWGKQEFAMFFNDKHEEIMQSLQAIRFVRCKPGEDNINSKLSNEQGLDIFKRAKNGESHAVLAAEFGVSRDYISAIKNLRARSGITLDYLSGNVKRPVATATIAKRNKGRKLSASLATFIRKDKNVNRLSVKQLASKYCVSDRTIQRIIRGDMYKETPIPTIVQLALPMKSS